MDGAGFLLFAREQRASGKAGGADDEELYEDWEDLAPAKQREYNDRAARKAAAKAGEKKPAGAVGSKPAPAPPLKTGPAGPSSAAPSPRDPTVKSTAKPTPAASVAAPTADKPGVPKPGVLKPSVSPSSSDAKATVGPAKLKFKQAATVAPSPSAPKPAPKKPRPAFDLFVLEAFAKLRESGADDAPAVDLSSLSEERLRTVCRLVFSNNTYGTDKSRSELQTAAAKYLEDGDAHALRFRKACAQADAKALWKAMGADERQPYEDKVRSHARERAGLAGVRACFSAPPRRAVSTQLRPPPGGVGEAWTSLPPLWLWKGRPYAALAALAAFVAPCAPPTASASPLSLSVCAPCARPSPSLAGAGGACRIPRGHRGASGAGPLTRASG